MPWRQSLASMFPARLRRYVYQFQQQLKHGKLQAKHVKYVRTKYLPSRLLTVRNLVPAEYLDAYLELFEDFDPLNETDRTPHTVQWPGYPYPLTLRKHSSDIPTFCQVFVDEQYEPAIRQIGPHGIVLDCGANIGLSAAWFLWKLNPKLVLALEPDPGNLNICKQNLAPWSTAAMIVQGGLWHTGGLSLDISDPGLLEWSIQCRGTSKAIANAPRTYTIPQLTALANATKIDLLKVDIEGAEADVFGVNWDQHCLSTVGNIAIELHGTACEEIFRKAVRGLSFNESAIGDVTWITDLKTNSPAQSVASTSLPKAG